MQWLRFLSRVTCILNFCFLFAILIRHTPFPAGGGLVSLVIILGYPIAYFVNLLLNLFYGMTLIFRKKWLDPVPRWLILVNFFFLVVETFLLSFKGI